MHIALRASVSCDEIEANLRPFGPLDFVWAETKHQCFTLARYPIAFRNERVLIYRVTTR